ncbi:hypothetical protein IU450_30440 [Nocardia abscessus]|uniref:hypothetical protein n=1 Tax=Nocardia abscessus TaxID=120957 RepID=UPI0018950B26|nr:hypothetical protein [Nocardia abscessus]MBF6340176.1 hypothetical protein [Nocardia abscessus]
MTRPTPWQARKIRHQQPASTSRWRRESRRLRAAIEKRRTWVRRLVTCLRENWGYLCAAAGSIVTFILLFKPWLATGGPDGTIWSNAFGQTHITTTLVGLWSQKPPAHTNLSGKWAILATIAIFLTVLAAVINLWARTEALARLTAGSAVAVALFIACTLVYLNGKGPELRGMIGSGPPTDIGTQMGFVIRWASGNGQYPLPGLRKVEFSTAKLTNAAILAGATAMFSAVTAVAQRIQRRKSHRHTD